MRIFLSLQIAEWLNTKINSGKILHKTCNFERDADACPQHMETTGYSNERTEDEKRLLEANKKLERQVFSWTR